VGCKAKCKRKDITKDAGVSEEDFFGDLPGNIETLEEVVRRPLPVKAVSATSPSKDGKHGQQTNQACG
jgi:hypothetical protein